MTRIALLATALGLMACKTNTPDRSSCSVSSSCSQGYVCAPWGRCSKACTSAAQCLAGESCLPSPGTAGSGDRWCGVVCGGPDGGSQAVCNAAQQFKTDTECREITYPGSSVSGWICSDPQPVADGGSAG